MRLVTANILILPAWISGVTMASDDDSNWMRFSDEIVRPLHDVAIGHFRHLQVVALEEARHQEVGVAVGGGDVELAGVGAHQVEEFAERFEVQRRRRRQRQRQRADVRHRDLIPIANVSSLSLALSAPASLNLKSFHEFFDLVRANPGKYNAAAATATPTS